MTSFPLDDTFTRALTLAQQWHAGQYRKGSDIPYISHILGVASVALEFGATQQQAIAALLHDALEDGPENTGIDGAVLREQIRAEFGDEVVRLVEGATDDIPAAGQAKAPWAQRKQVYLSKLAHEDAAALLVSASDKLHNARTILSEVLTLPAAQREGFFTRFSRGMAGTLWYYRALADHYQAAPGAQGQGDEGHARLQVLFAELERTVSALEVACGLSSDEVRAYT